MLDESELRLNGDSFQDGKESWVDSDNGIRDYFYLNERRITSYWFISDLNADYSDIFSQYFKK